MYIHHSMNDRDVLALQANEERVSIIPAWQTIGLSWIIQVSARSLPGVNLFTTEVRDLVSLCNGTYDVWFYRFGVIHRGDQSDEQL